MKKQCALLLILAAGCSLAPAATVEYIVEGLFAGNTPASVFSSPGAPFSIEFLLPEQPVPVSTSVADGWFAVNPGVQFFLSGIPVLFESSEVTFYNTSGSGGGLLDARFNQAGTTYVFTYVGPTIFSGPVTAPTMMGVFAPADLAFFDDGNSPVPFDIINGAVQASVIPDAPAGVPEPATWWLAAPVLAAMAFARRRILGRRR